MKNNRFYLAFFCGLALALGSAAAGKSMGIYISLFPQEGSAQAAAGSYSLDWYKVASGSGQISTGQNFELNGAIGQAVVGQTAGGAYKLESGFWPGTTLPKQVFVPLVKR